MEVDYRNKHENINIVFAFGDSGDSHVGLIIADVLALMFVYMLLVCVHGGGSPSVEL